MKLRISDDVKYKEVMVILGRNIISKIKLIVILEECATALKSLFFH